jgi:hypothetical protein
MLAKGLDRLNISVDIRELMQELDREVYDGNVSVRQFIKGKITSIVFTLDISS